jgi:alcohol dehydrogenase class IV
VKIPLNDDLILPDMAVLDARFTRSVPPAVTAATGMDVLAHALEAYVATAANAFTDLYAVHAIKYVFRYLVRCYRNGDDMEARQNMLLASCMAGMAFNNSGLGVTHSIAHTLGGIFHIPHGKANAVLLPYVIRFNSFDVRERYRTIASELDLPSDSVEQGNESLIEAVRWLNSQMDIPNTIGELGIEEDEFNSSLEVMATNAMDDRCTLTNPRRPSQRDLMELLGKAY